MHIFYHPDYDIPVPSTHRFVGSKFSDLYNHLQSQPFASKLKLGQPTPAPMERILRAHSSLYVEKVSQDELSKEDIEVEIIDVRTLIPFDAETCVSSVLRTGRLVILQEGQWFGGIAHSMQSRILEESFYALESAPLVIGALDTPVPFAPPLENHTVPSLEHVIKALRQVAQG